MIPQHFRRNLERERHVARDQKRRRVAEDPLALAAAAACGHLRAGLSGNRRSQRKGLLVALFF